MESNDRDEPYGRVAPKSYRTTQIKLKDGVRSALRFPLRVPPLLLISPSAAPAQRVACGTYRGIGMDLGTYLHTYTT